MFYSEYLVLRDRQTVSSPCEPPWLSSGELVEGWSRLEGSSPSCTQFRTTWSVGFSLIDCKSWSVCFACCVCHTSFIWFQVLRECNLDIRKWVVMQNLAVDLIFCCVICLFSRFKEGWLEAGRRRLSEWWWADSDLHDLHWTTNKPNKYSRMVFYDYDRNNNI